MSPYKINSYLIFGAIALVLTILFVGLFRDDEFYNPNLFIKYRPTLKINFYSPIGMSDMEMKNLSPDKQSEEIAFQEFVIDQHKQINHNATLLFLPFVLIQLTITLLTLGTYKRNNSISYKCWQPVTHFLINLIISVFGIAFMFSFDASITTISLICMLLIINYFTVYLLARRNIKQF